jgi:uncharacterized glyoxalase superfamily protein PhnB
LTKSAKGTGNVDNQSRPAGLVIPTLYYDDVGAAMEWLVKVFGFKERFHYGSGDEVAGCQLEAGGGFVMLGKSRAGQSPGWGDSAVMGPPRPGEFNTLVSVHVKDIDQHCSFAHTLGAKIIHQPTTYAFGERQYPVEDPFGVRWSFRRRWRTWRRRTGERACRKGRKMAASALVAGP